MLLKSLDHIFWLGRYLERLDDTARLINATSHLLIDSHKDSQFSWSLLLDVLGQNSVELLSQLPASDLTLEQQVMGFLITDASSQVSIRAACSALKQNARTVRQLIPRDMWEELNKLDIFLQQHCQQPGGRQQRARQRRRQEAAQLGLRLG